MEIYDDKGSIFSAESLLLHKKQKSWIFMRKPYALLVNTNSYCKNGSELSQNKHHICSALCFRQTIHVYLNLVVRKPAFRVSDQVLHKPGCAVTQDG